MERLSRERSELSRKNTRAYGQIVAKELYSTSEWWNGKDFHSRLSEIYVFL
jgi:hypothetical protein